MSLMQNTSEISKTDTQVYLVTLVRESADMPQYIDHMVYETTEGGQKFMARLVEAFSRAGYRQKKVSDDEYLLNNGLDKITLTGETQAVFKD
ncbi:hypothetical protein EAI26_07595 [Lactobacillus sp. 0.1XD8-4]|uniref:Uncharacterized protein n=1 Tax=Limosilactobacillus walteri TaxID=2268022 RepID=A0ABR8P7F7_9LACO|nr:hypothetical protein [Limosilactobacillus walteri]MBD5806639.1 hypothetical protein [Limosilactobacillus walteri]MRN07247.1 hypothetical protein [Lactobacillus sp. 0.1XD8-4]